MCHRCLEVVRRDCGRSAWPKTQGPAQPDRSTRVGCRLTFFRFLPDLKKRPWLTYDEWFPCGVVLVARTRHVTWQLFLCSWRFAASLVCLAMIALYSSLACQSVLAMSCLQRPSAGYTCAMVLRDAHSPRTQCRCCATLEEHFSHVRHHHVYAEGM